MHRFIELYIKQQDIGSAAVEKISAQDVYCFVKPFILTKYQH